ncbi:unnamed protein product [Enterobius vermicularis]|uniref:Thioredoxin-like_fold domain-containing protein n=1 Tax=Enterobius vermicularis TaxID=51028 RepID=A0A0N4UTI8_ENTVE|nr:unnamed protein product [Enterobius vermicularis]
MIYCRIYSALSATLLKMLQFLLYILAAIGILLIVRLILAKCFQFFFHYPTVFRKLHDENWEQDVVYLHQFHKSPVAPNLSPFCLKVESWLRANKLRYKAIVNLFYFQVCSTWLARSREGLLPFIEINGKQLADSQLIISHLQDHFKLHDDLTTKDRGIARAVDRMIEGSTFYSLLYSKAYENTHNLTDKKVSGVRLPSFILRIFAFLARIKIHGRLIENGVARHSRDDVIAILKKDLEAVNNLLEDKTYMFGEKMTLVSQLFEFVTLLNGHCILYKLR